MLTPMDQRQGLATARWLSAAALVVLLLPGAAAAQETSGVVRGRATVIDGSPAPGIEVRAQSAHLALARETTTDAQGYYLVPHLPPGDYVITFEHADFVTVRRITRVASRETVIADARMPEGPASPDVISISIDDSRYPRTPGVADVWRRPELDQLPVDGGLYSAATLASGTHPDGHGSSLLLIDGAPVRFGPPAGDRFLIDPGSMAVEQVAVMPAGIAAGASRFSGSVVSAVTRQGGDRFSGSVGASLTSANRLADDVDRAQGTRDADGGLEFGVGVPVDGRRTWLFAAGRRADDLGEVWELKATHAFDVNHRVHGLLLGGDRDWTAPDAPALFDRNGSHDLMSVRYSGLWGDAWHLGARATHERWNVTGAAGAVCADCRLDARTNTTWRFTAERAAALGMGMHHVTVGAEWSGGGIEGLSVSPEVLSHGAQSLFVSDEWQPTPNLTVQAGLHWDRQRLETAAADDPVASRSAIGPRVLAAWASPRTYGWTLYGGLARYEADMIDLVGHDLDPIGGRELRDRTPAAMAPTREWTVGASRRIGDEIFVRADLAARRREPLGDAPDAFATHFSALAVQLDYDLGVQADVGARYTLSRLHGVRADDEEEVAALPVGDLPGDRRQRLQFWGYVALIEGEEYGTAAVTALQTVASGQAYPAAGGIARAESAIRTDVRTSYSKPLPGTVRTQLVVRFDVLNLFADTRLLEPQRLFAPGAAPETMSRAYRAWVGVTF